MQSLEGLSEDTLVFDFGESGWAEVFGEALDRSFGPWALAGFGV